ncbi:hypothetical protein QYF36_008406 [Acer negundo]|nr:hypothetical protein QYF36_008406 [Acer negundo]
MGIYEVEIESGIEVKAKFIDKPSLVYENICELKSLLQLQTPVGGLDMKLQSGNWPWTGNSTARMMILCVANHCLIIQLDHFDVFPEMEDLAARVLKKPYINELGLAYLANEAGVNPSVAGTVFSSAGATGGSTWIDYSARAFTEEEIKCVIREAYTCYAIGNKLLNML